jgi:hypothetical protein
VALNVENTKIRRSGAPAFSPSSPASDATDPWPAPEGSTYTGPLIGVGNDQDGGFAAYSEPRPVRSGRRARAAVTDEWGNPQNVEVPGDNLLGGNFDTNAEDDSNTGNSRIS